MAPCPLKLCGEKVGFGLGGGFLWVGLGFAWGWLRVGLGLAENWFWLGLGLAEVWLGLGRGLVPAATAQRNHVRTSRGLVAQSRALRLFRVSAWAAMSLTPFLISATGWPVNRNMNSRFALAFFVTLAPPA